MESAEIEPTNSGAKPSRVRVPRSLARVAALAVTGAIGFVTGGVILALWGLHLLGRLSQSTSTVLDLVKLAFALVAGVGGTVGLVLAYRRHQIAEEVNLRERAKELREDTRLFNERFEKAAAQLGSSQYSVRMAGIYAMGGLADDWPQGRQRCIDVLCANLRQGYLPEPADLASAEHLAFRENRQFRHTLIREVAAHLRPEASVSWRGCDFDFRGAAFDGAEFNRIVISDGKMNFSGATFTGGTMDFRWISIESGVLDFFETTFVDTWINFSMSRFGGNCREEDGRRILDGLVTFIAAKFTNSRISFGEAEFDGSDVWFGRTAFSDVLIEFDQSEFKAGEVDFSGAHFKGGSPLFEEAKFMGASVDFSRSEWDSPPKFDFDPRGSLPPGLQLPKGKTKASKAAQST